MREDDGRQPEWQKMTQLLNKKVISPNNKKMLCLLVNTWSPGPQTSTKISIKVQSSSPNHHFPIIANICHHLSPSATICHHQPPSVTISHLLSPSATFCQYLSPNATICHHLSSSPCHQLLQSDTIRYHQSPCVTNNHYLPSSAELQLSFLSF